MTKERAKTIINDILGQETLCSGCSEDDHEYPSCSLCRKDAAEMSIKALDKSRWIPCTERLPESKTAYYIVTLESRDRICVLPNDIDIARWDYDRRKGKDSWHWCKERKVIAWMDLPEPYRKESKK